MAEPARHWSVDPRASNFAIGEEGDEDAERSFAMCEIGCSIERIDQPYYASTKIQQFRRVGLTCFFADYASAG